APLPRRREVAVQCGTDVPYWRRAHEWPAARQVVAESADRVAGEQARVPEVLPRRVGVELEIGVLAHPAEIERLLREDPIVVVAHDASRLRGAVSQVLEEIDVVAALQAPRVVQLETRRFEAGAGRPQPMRALTFVRFEVRRVATQARPI